MRRRYSTLVALFIGAVILLLSVVFALLERVSGS